MNEIIHRVYDRMIEFFNKKLDTLKQKKKFYKNFKGKTIV